jgi:cytochrome c oxidase assembly protein subunit 11
MAALAAAMMVGVAYASVPLYRLFCQVTGWAGTTQRAEAAPSAPVPGKTISVRFDSNTGGGIPWLFRPEKTAVTVPIGGKQIAFYKAVNQSASTVTGSAVFNVSPDDAGKYFTKIECFCFTEQTLKPGESVDMPVTYYIDPAILEDPVASRISEITLSYTFYPVDRTTQSGRDDKTRG